LEDLAPNPAVPPIPPISAEFKLHLTAAGGLA